MPSLCLSLGKQVLALTFAAGSVFLATASQAGEPIANYPDKPVRLVVPFPAGGGSDILGRLLAQRLSDELGQPVIVENKPGASGMLGADAVAKAKPDGYTLLLGATPLVQLQTVYKKLPYDTEKDLAPIARIALSSDIFGVPSTSGINSVQQFIEQAKAEPGKFSYGTYGNGTSAHMHGELLAAQSATDLVHVPYKGTAPLMQDILGGQVGSAFAEITGARAHLASPRIKILAVTGETRLRALPDVPTFTELGYRDYEPNGWYGLLAPMGTPAPILDGLEAKVMAILGSPEISQKISDLGLEPGPLAAAAFGQVMKRDTAIWGRIASEAQISLD